MSPSLGKVRAPRRLDPRHPGGTWSSKVGTSGRVAPALLTLALLAGCGGSDPGPGSTTTTLPTATSAPDPQTTIATTGQTEDEATTLTTMAPGEAEEDPLEIEVENGEVLGGPPDLSVELGSTVHVEVTSDVQEHVHVHGYDLFFDVAPGEVTEIMFVADVPGIFEVELEGTHTLLMKLEVS